MEDDQDLQMAADQGPLEQGEEVEVTDETLRGDRWNRLTAQLQFQGGIWLITHEDKHNWNKLHHFVYITLALFAGYGVVLEELVKGPQHLPDVVLAVILCVIAFVGRLLSLGFAKTLRDGIICLKNHRQIIDDLEERFEEHGHGGQPTKLSCRTFGNKRPPTRIMVLGSPLAVAMLWSQAFLVPIAYMVYPGDVPGATWFWVAYGLLAGPMVVLGCLRTHWWFEHVNDYNPKKRWEWYDQPATAMRFLLWAIWREPTATPAQERRRQEAQDEAEKKRAGLVC